MILQLQVLGELFLAMILGGAIGFERETADKPAGLRTHMVVAGSAALLTGLGRILVLEFDMNESLISADPIQSNENLEARTAACPQRASKMLTLPFYEEVYRIEEATASTNDSPNGVASPEAPEPGPL